MQKEAMNQKIETYIADQKNEMVALCNKIFLQKYKSGER